MQAGGNYSGGNLNLTQQQLQQMMLMQQQGAQYGNVLGYNPQYAVQAAVGAAHRPASVTPPPGIPQTQPLHQQHVVQQQPQQQQQQQVARVSDTGDDGFDLDDIPSPGGSPAGAGAGPTATAPQQQQQQGVNYVQPVSQASTLVHQIPGQMSAQQQMLLQQQQQQQRQQAQFPGRQQISQQSAQSQPQQSGVQRQAPQSSMPAQLGQLHAGRQPQQQQHGSAPAATRPNSLTSAQQQLAAADQVALHSRKGGVVNSNAALKTSSFSQQVAPGQDLPPAAQAALAARQASQQPQSHHPTQHVTPQPRQQQQQPQQPVQHQTQQQATGSTGVKRKREPAPLLPAPDDALNLETVIFRLRQHMPLSSTTSAGAAGPVDGPAVSVDDILKKYEAAKAKSAAPGIKGSKAGSKDSKRDDENRLLPESQLRRIMELQGLSKSFRLQPELADELMKLTDNFVIDALDFGCSLAARRSNRTLRTSDLALYMQRTYHLHIPGFSKEYTAYKRPVASELHKSRSVAVRKAQLQPQLQQQQGGAAAQGAGGKAGGASVRFSMD